MSIGMSAVAARADGEGLVAESAGFLSEGLVHGVGARGATSDWTTGLNRGTTGGITESCVAPGQAWRGGMVHSMVRRNPQCVPAGLESRPVKVGHQPEPSVAWCTGNRHCEAYTGSAQAA